MKIGERWHINPKEGEKPNYPIKYLGKNKIVVMRGGTTSQKRMCNSTTHVWERVTHVATVIHHVSSY